MSGVHKYPTISFRISPREREEIEAKILASGLSKKDYFVRSCIYNRVCVVGKKGLVYQLVEELKVMQTNIRKVTEQFEKTEIALTSEGLEDMRNDCLDMLKAIRWVLDGAKYLWQDSDAGAEESTTAATVRTVITGKPLLSVFHKISIAEVFSNDNDFSEMEGIMEETKTELQMIKMSEIQSQEVSWLWFPFIPYGKLTIVQGDPGDGKTTLVLNIAAKLSKGEGLNSEMKLTEPLNVIYQTAEDGLADTVKPRLELAGADCENISVIDESIKSLSMIDERLEEAIIRTKAKMLILDPIQAYLGGGMDMNRANEARDMTKKLAALAEKYQCAIVLVGHMNKAAGNKAAYRGMGSIDFFAVARSVLLVGRVEGETNIRAVVQIKNNLAAFGHKKPLNFQRAVFSGLEIMKLRLMKSWAVTLQKQIRWSRRNAYSGNWRKRITPCKATKLLIWRTNREYRNGHWKMQRKS